MHLFSKYLLSIYYVRGFVLVTKNNAVDSTDKFPALMELALCLVVVEGDTDKTE